MKDILICPKCGEKLTDSGIKEVTVGGTTETDIYFGLPDGDCIDVGGNRANRQETHIKDCDEEWVVCLACGEELHDRTASQIAEAYEEKQQENDYE